MPPIHTCRGGRPAWRRCWPVLALLAITPDCYPAANLISQQTGESDYPSACVAPDGSAWAVWQTYAEGRDALFAARWSGGRWDAPVDVAGVRGELYKPACGVDGKGRLWVVWSQFLSSDWDLWSASWDGSRWSAPERVAAAAGTDFAPRIARKPDGGLAMVWQAWRGPGFDVLMAETTGGRWSAPETVSEHPASDWSPSLAVSRDGAIAVSWDSYRNGDYDVFLRRKLATGWSAEIPIARSALFEANSSAAIDSAGNVWIAYEERTAEWGKDSGATVPARLLDGLISLLGPSRIRVRCLDRNGAVLEPEQPPPFVLRPYEFAGDLQPVIVVGPEDRIWLSFRRPSMDQPGWSVRPAGQSAAIPDPPSERRAAGSVNYIPLSYWWNLYAVQLNGQQWSAPISFTDAGSRVDSDMSALALPNGDLLGVWHSDNRKLEINPRFRYSVPTANRIYSSVLQRPAGSPRPPVTRPVTVAAPADAAEGARERNAVRTARSYRADISGKVHRLYRGDLHRHTAVSWDGAMDGSLTDMFRYAIDAAALDFIAATDHNQTLTGVDIEWIWWRNQKLTEIFNAPPFFVTLFGYERGLAYPNGHRNIIQAQRGHRTFPATKDPAGKPGVAPDDTRQLFASIRPTGGITIPHQIGENGNAWLDNDPEVEPIVEIFQGCRNSYEYEGAPRADSRSRPAMNYTPEGFMWRAWQKDYRLGVIASSDHQSTHISYANVFATALNREALLDAMKRRHTYGSTDNIVLDFRAGSHMQGDDFEAGTAPPFHIQISGTAPIRELAIIKNYQFVYTTRSDSPALALDWRDTGAGRGASMYYVRVLQADGELAWSSPIWVKLP